MDHSIANQRQVVEALWAAVNERRFSDVESAYDPEVVYHASDGSELRGARDVIDLLRAFVVSLPSIETKLEAAVGDGSLLSCRVHTSIASTTNDIDKDHLKAPRSFSMLSTVRILDGRIAEEWAAFGPLDLIRQAEALAA